jgi:hypothetical protein
MGGEKADYHVQSILCTSLKSEVAGTGKGVGL